MKDKLWHKNVLDCCTIDGACAINKFFKHWDGRRLVIHNTEMPIKCFVAPLEFTFLADWYFTKRGIKDKVDIHFITPLPSAFTKPKSSFILGDLSEKKNINLVPDFHIARVYNDEKKVVS